MLKLLLPLWGKLSSTSVPGTGVSQYSVLPWLYCLRFPINGVFYLARCTWNWSLLLCVSILGSFYHLVLFYCMDIPQLAHLFSGWRTVSFPISGDCGKKLPQVSVYGFSYQHFFVNTWHYLVHENKFEVLSEINSAHCIIQKRSDLDSCS